MSDQPMNGEDLLESPEGICQILQPLFDIDGVRDLNGWCGRRLAEVIHPRDASDLTVREVKALLDQIGEEINRERTARLEGRRERMDREYEEASTRG